MTNNASKHQKKAIALEYGDFFADPALPIQVRIADPQTPLPLHKHNFDELVFIISGTATHTVNNQSFSIHQGDVFVISRSHKHQYHDMLGLVLANILFDGDSLGMKNWDIRSLPGFHVLFELEPKLRSQSGFNSRLHLSGNQQKYAQILINKLLEETTSHQPGFRVISTGLFMQLAVFLSRCHENIEPDKNNNLLRLGNTMAYMESNFADQISLDELAYKAHLSNRQFQRIFSYCTGKTPIEYLMNIRIKKAIELLQYTDHQITEIAFACGFNDSNYFTRCFKQITKKTPTQIRKTGKIL